MFQQRNTQQVKKIYNSNADKEYGMYAFKDRNLLVRALSNKIQELEYQQKNGKVYKFGNNEEFCGMGQQLLEFFFFDHMISNKELPNPTTQIKKMGDLIMMRQKLLQEKNISELAVQFKVHQYIQTGKQVQLRSNPKNQAETFKALIGAHYKDSDYDLEYMREFMAPIFEMLLEKNQHLDLNEAKVNSKSQFYEFLNEHQEYKPKVSLEWDRIFENGQNITQFTYQMNINDKHFLAVKGTNKRQTEQNLFKRVLQSLKSEINNQPQSSINRADKAKQDLNESQFLNDDDLLIDKSHHFLDQSELIQRPEEFNLDKLLDGLVNQ